MRLAFTGLAMALLLSGCANKSRTARATIPPNPLPPMMQRQVLNAVDAGEGNPRVREMRTRIAAQPKDVKVRLELAAEYGKSGYPELELEHLRLAVERFPESEAAATQLARTLVRANQPAEAIRVLEQALAAKEKPSANLLSWAAIAHDEAKEWKLGEALHRRALERAPGRDTLHNNLGYNLLMQGRKAEAADSFRRALDLNPASETARNNLGLALGSQPAAALMQFRQNSDLAVAHNNLASYFYDKGDLAAARKELELALEYRTDIPQILDNLRRISAVDGMPIRLPRQGQHSFWKTFARGLKQTFVTSDDKSSTAGHAEAAR